MEINFLTDFGSAISYIMYIFSNALLYPVMILLMLLVVVILMMTGEYITEYTRRHKDGVAFEKTLNTLSKALKEPNGNEKAADILRNMEGQAQLVTSFSKNIADYVKDGNTLSVGRLADDYETRMVKRTEKTRIITTVGPMLGLMGTLIPLSPALMGLTSGNVENLVSNLVIAFATTVVGLFSAGIAYCLTVVRSRWYWQDMIDIDYIIDVLEAKE
ncbi:MotA/TolQ/ExbB proton channel family protein [Methanolapillus millepedarum]|uniref:MotA/TolQ/ExbB proton channel domain-containing protein n=1 Tax=Methanolapillus millepedarum TaxID=3028296 RepID=A0AA96V562_9EURY|nr:hypothetical protein MsAc7_16080 [Methanosarcinaceae archaeon Ac7]